MNVHKLPSRCCSKLPIKFRWYGFPAAKTGQDFHVASKAFVKAIASAGYELSIFLEELAIAEFEFLLTKAQNGLLRSVKEVKNLRAPENSPLYELRWQNLSVNENQTVSLRMYHSEPITAPGFFIGHHIHVKDLRDPDAISQLQDKEIDIALNFYISGLSTNWGIAS